MNGAPEKRRRHLPPKSIPKQVDAADCSTTHVRPNEMTG